MKYGGKVVKSAETKIWSHSYRQNAHSICEENSQNHFFWFSCSRRWVKGYFTVPCILRKVQFCKQVKTSPEIFRCSVVQNLVMDFEILFVTNAFAWLCKRQMVESWFQNCVENNLWFVRWLVLLLWNWEFTNLIFSTMLLWKTTLPGRLWHDAISRIFLTNFQTYFCVGEVFKTALWLLMISSSIYLELYLCSTHRVHINH